MCRSTYLRAAQKAPASHRLFSPGQNREERRRCPRYQVQGPEASHLLKESDEEFVRQTWRRREDATFQSARVHWRRSHRLISLRVAVKLIYTSSRRHSSVL